MKLPFTVRGAVIVVLQVALVLGLVGGAWMIHRQLPASASDDRTGRTTTTLQIVLRQPADSSGFALDVPISLYPVDIVAVRHEFFTEPRAGKRFEDFLKERMKGRSPINARLDKQGQGIIALPAGNWWLHATLPGEEQLEWRLPVNVTGTKQIVELTSQNAYTRSKSF